MLLALWTGLEGHGRHVSEPSPHLEAAHQLEQRRAWVAGRWRAAFESRSQPLPPSRARRTGLAVVR